MLLLEIELVKPEQVELVPNSRESVWDGWIVGVVRDLSPEGAWPRKDIPWVALPRYCFLEFVNDLGGPDRSRTVKEMVGFVRQYGPLQKGHFEPPRESKKAMKVWDSLQSKQMRRFATPLADIVANRDMFLITLRLWNLLSQGKFKEAEAAIPKSLRKLVEPVGMVERALSTGLKVSKVRISIEKKRGSVRVTSTLVFDSLLSALYAQFWQETGGNLELQQCEKCSRWFRKVRELKRFCSLSCQQAEKQRRYREKLARKGKKARGRK